MIRRPLPLLIIVTTLAAWSSARCQDAPKARPAEFTARVVGIADGDTLTVLRPDRTQVKIRLHGIDAPETGQDFGAKAKEAASALAFDKAVTIRPVEQDRYGRTVAEVILPDGRSMNRQLVKGSMAWHYRQFAPDDRELARLESEARKAQRGLWSLPGPVAPWEWRKPKADESQTEEPADATTVYITATGKKYHRAGCRHLAKSSRPLPLATAAKGYGACSVCKPPMK